MVQHCHVLVTVYTIGWGIICLLLFISPYICAKTSEKRTSRFWLECQHCQHGRRFPAFGRRSRCQCRPNQGKISSTLPDTYRRTDFSSTTANIMSTHCIPAWTSFCASTILEAGAAPSIQCHRGYCFLLPRTPAVLCILSIAGKHSGHVCCY